MKIRQIGISDYFVSNSSLNLRTSGLGSCVGVILYDKTLKIGGMAHIMLPESPRDKNNIELKKYCDVCMPIFLERMAAMGVRIENIKAAIYGGAEMFPFRHNPLMNIGKRNIEMVEKILKEKNIPVVKREVGGSKGRTVEFNIEKGEIHLRTAYENEQTFIFD